MAHYSLLIKNGRVFDGRGNPAREVDIGIGEDRIEAMGELEKTSADRIIDAGGKYVTPGFIDVTNHSDTHWTLFTHPAQESMLRQGVTTILGGNCGASLAPLVSGEDIEGLQRWVDVREININWQTFDELASELEERAFGVNVATLVGFGTLRRGVLGVEGRAANSEEIRQMKFLLERAFTDGAFGLSFHLGVGYEQAAENLEIVELLGVAALAKRFVKHHLEDEGLHLLPAISRVLTMSRGAAVRTHLSHFKALGRSAWEQFASALVMIERAQEAGLALTLDFFPYTRTGSHLLHLLPEWARVGNDAQILERLRSVDGRRSVTEALRQLTLHYDRITIASSQRNVFSVGKTIAILAENAGVSPEEVLIELLIHNDLRVTVFNEVISPEHIQTLAAKPYAMVASDGVGHARGAASPGDLPHPRSFGAFPRALEWFTKEQPLLSWEEAIYKMTGFPALLLGIRDRGVLAPGAFADIVIFSPEELSVPATYENPYLPVKGITHVIVNGAVALEEGELPEKFSGKFLRSS